MTLKNLLPVLLSTMLNVENATKEAGQGEKKKAATMATMKSFVYGTAALSKGGQRKTWEKLAPELDVAIDNIVKMWF